MYDKILVHVDRKSTFESYLPFLDRVLRRGIAKQAVLTTVVKPCEPTLFGYVLDPDDVARTDARNIADAEAFMERMAEKFEGEGVAVQTRILVGDPADEFRRFASQGAFDLVVIAPTGRRYLLTGKPRPFRRALHDVAKPVMILQALPAPARAA